MTKHLTAENVILFLIIAAAVVGVVCGVEVYP
jgi:hypothetical protein